GPCESEPRGRPTKKRPQITADHTKESSRGPTMSRPQSHRTCRYENAMTTNPTIRPYLQRTQPCTFNRTNASAHRSHIPEVAKPGPPPQPGNLPSRNDWPPKGRESREREPKTPIRKPTRPSGAGELADRAAQTARQGENSPPKGSA